MATSDGPGIGDLAVEMGMCGLCALRFAGCRYAPSYLTPWAALKLPPREEAPCLICLGVLQWVRTPDALEAIAAKVAAGGRTFSSFNVAVSHPVHIAIREQAAWLHLKSLLPDRITSDRPGTKVPTVKDAMRYTLVEPLAKLLEKPASLSGEGLEISITFSHAPTADEWRAIQRARPDACRSSKKRRGGSKQAEITTPSQTVVDMVLDSVGANLTKHASVPPAKIADGTGAPAVRLNHTPLWLAGRYIKLSRTLSQSPWHIEGEGFRTESSTEQELTGPITARYNPAAIKFTASGREDVDVRMLGTGRPFMLELIDSKKHVITAAELAEISDEINSKPDAVVLVRDLQVVERADTETLKDGETSKTKTYSCVVWVERDPTDDELCGLDVTDGVVINQDTPIRVLHRRTNMSRPRTVHWIKYTRLKPNFLKLWLATQAGTYIKEFVHGDFGRTTPNVGTLLGGTCGQVDILSLDVIEVGLDWPPSLEEGGGGGGAVSKAKVGGMAVDEGSAAAADEEVGERKRKAESSEVA